MSSTTRRIGAAMMWSVAARVARFALGMASSIIVVRALGDHDYGVLSLARTILMFALIVAAGGLGQAVLKFLPALRVEGATRQARALVRRVVYFHLGAWLVLCAVAFASRGWVEGVFGIEGLGWVVAVAVAMMLFELLFQLLTQLLNSNYDTKRLGIATVAGHAVYIAVLVVLMSRGAGVIGVLAATAAGFLVSCVIVLGRVGPAVTFDGDADGGGVTPSRLARYSIPFIAVGILNLVVWRQSETLLLGYFRSAEETGYFDLAYRMSQLVLEFVPATVWPLVMAGASEAYARNPANLRRTIDRYYRMLFILCAPICVTGMVLGGRMIPILFSQQMAPAAVPTQLFFGIFTLSFFGTPLSMSLYVMEKTHINLIVYVALAVVNVGLDLVLIPRFGVAGAMVPVAAVIAVSPLVYRAVVARFLPGVCIPWGFVARCFLASAPVVVLVPVLRFIDGPLALAGAFVAAGVLLVFSFKFGRVVGREEREMLGSVPFPLADRLLRFMSS